MMKYGITPRQKRILECIKDFTKANGFAPSYEEINQLTKLHSKSRVHFYIHQLEKRGYITFIPGKMRSIVVLD
tara:strand:- start:1986 stop:2204 length:219 start_codon:yes stop_codon:yes gene_type:complete